MYLKQLELVGFKSFPSKTQFSFNDGITAIVGPNGCGKTNLLDALRWVLGEQKTSLLRGSKMEEVIFAGTRTLKPLGMAEVSLHVANRNGVLPSHYRELTITRRLFRSGESEYLMNKVPCRLKDITELFADTGMGAHAYAIIQQDMVDAILSDKTEDRRFLFEEAAGITKYKIRKVAAERKLEATEQDLLRLQDILSEVTTQVISLKRQVSKAERYKSVSEELRRWQIYLTKARYDEAGARRMDLALVMKALADKKLAFDAGLDSRFAEAESLRATLTEIDHGIANIGQRIMSLSDQAHQRETAVSVNREKRENLVRSVEQLCADIEALVKRAAAIREEKQRCHNDQERMTGEITGCEGQLEQARARQTTADSSYLQYRSQTEEEHARLVELQGRISSGRTDSAGMEEQIRELQSEIERLTERKTSLIDEKRRRRAELGSLQAQIDASRRKQAESESQLAATEKNLAEMAAESETIRDRITETTATYEADSARRKLLAEMVEHHEGFGSGVVAIFEIAARWVDITGTVADFIRPGTGYQTAIDAALGETAQYIICQTQTTAREAVDFLKNQRAGKASFLILDRLPSPADHNALPQVSGVIGWADQLVDCEERYRHVPVALLGRTVVCENSDAAMSVLGQLPEGYRAVTLSGDLYTQQGVISGGASEEISLVGRKNEVDALTQKLADLDHRISAFRHTQAEATLRTGELRQTSVRLTQAVAEERDKVSELISRLKEEQFKINAADEITTTIEQQADQLVRRLEKLKHRQYTLSLDFDQLDREKSGMSAQVESKKAQLAELERTAQGAEEQVRRLQMNKIELESKRSNLESQANYFAEMLSDIDVNCEMKEQQIVEADQSAGALVEQIRQDEVELKNLFDRRQIEEQAQQEHHRRRDETALAIDAVEDQIRKARREKEETAEEMHQAELALTEINAKLEQLTEHARVELECAIEEADGASPDPAMSTEQAGAHIEDLRDKMRKMGDVNLLALEEYRQQKERQDFLARQLDDLITAKATLRATIQKINQTARSLFLETMEKARANFKQMYQELFTGGEADVYLENEDDPLESRIEVVSRPRGKKPLTINQLSGGEKALTAIALLFALYMVKPSPFCFLDEIDAPLDDINVGRFLKIVRHFSQQTQFIIITHNKITMEAADTLYGVTMEEPGVSKVVAVRFKREGEDESGTLLDLHYSEDNVTHAG